jgi:DNA-binding transcriptional LysR family regulator
MINWDDLRVFIAVTQSGSFAKAGVRLGMDATTVARRIQRLETSLRATLVVRRRQGLQLTAAGVRLCEAGASFEAAMATASEEGAVNPLAGTVRLSIAEGFGASIVAPAMADFLERRPGLKIEIDASPGFLSPTTRKVDLSITSSPPGGARLVVERLADYELGLYASKGYLGRRGVPAAFDDLKDHDFIGCVDDLVYSEQLKFLDAFSPNLRQRIKCTSMKMQIVLASSGCGLGAFPHYLVDDNPQFVRVLPDRFITRTYWMATHHELYEVARVRTVRHWLQALCAEHWGRLAPSQVLEASDPERAIPILNAALA